MNLVGSTPPKVSSPFVLLRDAEGSKEMPTSCASIRPWLNALSVTVGMHWLTSGMSVPGDQVRDSVLMDVNVSRTASQRDGADASFLALQ